MEQDAFIWFRSVSDQRAYRDGVELAQKEAGGSGKVAEMLAKKQGRAEA